MPILNGVQPEAVEDSKVALNDPRSVARAHPTTALSYEIRAYKTYAVCFIFYAHLIASSERDGGVNGLRQEHE